MLKYSPFVTGKIQTVTHCWKRCLVHLAGVRQLMFYQLGVNDIHTISSSACVLTRFPVYHPGNVVWFGVGEGILLIQVPANLTKGSPIINVCVNKGDGARRKAGKGDCRSWWEVFPLLPLLCGTFPWRRKRWRQTSPEPRLLLPRVLRWAEGLSILLRNSSSVRSHAEVPGNEDQACEVYSCLLYCTGKTSFNTGGTAAKCTHDPVDGPAKLIRNRGQEKKLTIAKFPCYCWFFKRS